MLLSTKKKESPCANEKYTFPFYKQWISSVLEFRCFFPWVLISSGKTCFVHSLTETKFVLWEALSKKRTSSLTCSLSFVLSFFFEGIAQDCNNLVTFSCQKRKVNFKTSHYNLKISFFQWEVFFTFVHFLWPLKFWPKVFFFFFLPVILRFWSFPTFSSEGSFFDGSFFEKRSKSIYW